MKKFNLFAIMFLIGIGGTSIAFAKGHDQGRADAMPMDPSILRGGLVASHDVAGVGRDAEGNFLGVADSLNSDINYGLIVVQDQVEANTRRVFPVVNDRR